MTIAAMTPAHPQQNSGLIQLPTDVFTTHLIENLTQSDQTPLLQTCKFAYTHTILARKHLDLISDLLTDANLARSIELFSNVKSIRLHRLQNVSEHGIRTLIPLVSKRAFTNIAIESLERVGDANPVWLELLNSTHFGSMEVFRAPYIFAGLELGRLMKIFIEKVSSNNRLKRVQINPSVFSHNRHLALALIRQLPPTLTDLDFPQIDITRAIAERLPGKYNREVITSCNLRFNKLQISEEQLLAFLRFLPLHQMKKIIFVGDALTTNCFDYISSQLRKNTVLECLELSQDPHPINSDLELLIQSIQSPKVKTLSLCVEQTPFIRFLLGRKGSLWKNIETIKFKGYSFSAKPLILSDVKPLLQREAALKEIETPCETTLELLSLIEELINMLEATPRDTIIHHYQLLLSTLWGLPVGAKVMPSFSENFAGTSIELIRSLEKYFDFEYKQRVQTENPMDQILLELSLGSVRNALSRQQNHEAKEKAK